MFTLGENFIIPLMSFTHHNDLSVNTSWRYLCNYRATEKIKVTFGDQIVSTQRVSFSSLRHRLRVLLVHRVRYFGL